MNALPYIAARAVLLDALDALGEQREALILAGAQAIYVHTGSADLAVAEFTTDGDLVVEPAQLKTAPRLSAAMEGARFRLGLQPGSWLRDHVIDGVMTTIPIDLLVPEAVAGPGRRAARLGDHGDHAGRRVRGLEGALIDHSIVRLTALDASDPRAFDTRVAGPSALLVAKLHKLADPEPGNRGQAPEGQGCPRCAAVAPGDPPRRAGLRSPAASGGSVFSRRFAGGDRAPERALRRRRRTGNWHGRPGD